MYWPQTPRACHLEDGSAEAVNSGAAVDASEHSVAVRRAFAQAVAFAERGAVPSAAFERRCYFSGPPVGVLFPAVAEAFGVPDFAWRRAYLAVVDISGRLKTGQCLAHCTCGAERRSHG